MFCLMELNFEQNSVVLGMTEIYGRGYDRTSGSFFFVVFMSYVCGYCFKYFFPDAQSIAAFSADQYPRPFYFIS